MRQLNVSTQTCRCGDQTSSAHLTMFLNECDLIGSSAASDILLRMMKMRMKLVK